MALPMKDKDKKKATKEQVAGAAEKLKNDKKMDPKKKKRVAEKLKAMLNK